MDECWGQLCDFTGSRTQPDANPARCTNTGGYLAGAEIDELTDTRAVRMFHDGDSNMDVILYQGDCVSYMTPTTKETRRADWRRLNFAGSVDWAVDLQSFTADDMVVPADRPADGEEGCVRGDDDTVDSGDLCFFSCDLGFCPRSLCTCMFTGTVRALPAETNSSEFVAWDEFNNDLTRLCQFACRYGHCPDDICTTVPTDLADDDSTSADSDAIDQANLWKCTVYKDPSMREEGSKQCYITACKEFIEQDLKEGKTANWGCVGRYLLNETIPWVAAVSLLASRETMTFGYQFSLDTFLLVPLHHTSVLGKHANT
jgi:hypothetical protein